jgi:hypothetical protein
MANVKISDLAEITSLGDNDVEEVETTGGAGGKVKKLTNKKYYNRASVNYQTTDYALQANDEAQEIEIDSSAAKTLTVPPDSSVNFPVGTVIPVTQIGTGQVSVAPGAGVTLLSPNGYVGLSAQYSVALLRKRSANQWLLRGDLAPSGIPQLAAPVLSKGTETATTIPLTWTDGNSSPNEISFELQTSPNGSTGWTALNNPAANATSFTDTGIANSTTKYYRIRAVGDNSTCLTSPWSNVVSGTTTSGGPTYQDIPFTSNAQVTNTAQVFTPGASAAAGWDNLVMSSVSLPGDGYIDFVRQSDSDVAMLGLAASAGLAARADINAGAIVASNGSVYFQDAPSGGGSPTGAGGAASVGDRIRIKRTGSVIALFTVAGGTETHLLDYTYSTTAALHIWVAVFSPGGKLYSPKGLGVA